MEAQIKSLLRALKINASTFAKEIGVSSGNISNWKNSDMPGGKVLKKIHDKFKVNINWFLTGRGEMFVENHTSFWQYYFEHFRKFRKHSKLQF